MKTFATLFAVSFAFCAFSTVYANDEKIRCTTDRTGTAQVGSGHPHVKCVITTAQYDKAKNDIVVWADVDSQDAQGFLEVHIPGEKSKFSVNFANQGCNAEQTTEVDDTVIFHFRGKCFCEEGNDDCLEIQGPKGTIKVNVDRV